MSFTCPRCGATSANANDEREGYCGRCHDWTGEPKVRLERPLPIAGQGGAITEVWAWTAFDPLTDTEGIVAMRTAAGGGLPLVATMRSMIERMRPYAEAAVRSAEEPRPMLRLRRFVPAEEE